VPVAVHGHSNGAVSEKGLDRLRVFTVCHQPGGVGVSQVVDLTWRDDGP
jgi:hypothetical protein